MSKHSHIRNEAGDAKTACMQARAARVSLQKKGRAQAKSKPTSKQAAVTGMPSIMAVMASGVTAAAAQPRVKGPVVQAGGRLKLARSSKSLLLWIGDVLVPTGFATVTHAVLNHLRHDWEVIVSGVNYDGSSHELPYDVMPAWQGGDMWGMNRFKHLCTEFDPAAVIINNDWWNVAEFAKTAPEGVRIIGYMPVDGGNLDTAAMLELNRPQ